MVELEPQQPALQASLLAVRTLLGKAYQPYARRLPAFCQPSMDWLNQDLLPTLVLLPNMGETAAEAQVLALALEISFLAGRVHDLTALARKEQFALINSTSQAILVGDYLYAAAAIKMVNSGYNQWLGRVGRTLCRRSEGKLARLSWQTRAYVPEEERLLNLHKENAEGLALAAELAVAKLDWRPKERQAWAEFGFYVGQAQGLLLLEPVLRRPGCAAFAEALAQAEQALVDLPWLHAAAEELILKRLFKLNSSPHRLLSSDQNNDGDNKKNIR